MKSDSLKDYDYNVWREVYYYAWIRNKINFRNISPNFVSSYCYFITKEEKLKNKNLKPIDPVTGTIDILKVDTNCTLTLLTESPNYNIYQWGSNLYSQDKGINKMINSGFKPEIHWKSVIAQILIIFYIMDKHCFTINQMNIKSNFYIKILNVYGDIKQFWEYTIGNIDFYIPNFGHLVMLDHNYKDFKKDEFKIVMKDVFNNDSTQIKKIIFENAVECLNAKNFGPEFTTDGGVDLSTSVIDYLNAINNTLLENKDKNDLWLIIIKKHLLDYVHNRVGTPIRDLEVNYINKFDTGPKRFKNGELVVREVKFETYKILLVIENDENKESSVCVTRDKLNNVITEIVANDLLYHYSEFDSIKQDSKPGIPFIGNENIIERYIL